MELSRIRSSATTTARASSRFQRNRCGAAFTACRSSSPCEAASTASCQACGRCAGSRLSILRLTAEDSLMSDHGSGPRALTDPAADLTDAFAFPAPRNPQHLVVVMDVFSRAGPSAAFSDAVIYRFRFRRVSVAVTGPGAAFAVDDDEATFDFTFDVPEGADTTRPLQRGRCQTPSGETVSFHVNDEKGASGSGVHVFAGRRSDPFFLN